MNRRFEGHEPWSEQLSDYLNGDLASGEYADLEDHLARCADCRGLLEELSHVTMRAAELGPVEPPRDLWGGIAATIRAPAPAPEATVIELPVGPSGRPAAATERQPRRRFELTTPQLVAASLVLVAASSLATWVAGPGLGSPAPVPSPVGVTGDAGPVRAVDQAFAPPVGLAEELAEIEAVVLEARGRLDPDTFRTLERNMGIIEQAIQESRRALAQDPGNEFLAEHLGRVYQRKLDYLRDAVRVVEWEG